MKKNSFKIICNLLILLLTSNLLLSQTSIDNTADANTLEKIYKDIEQREYFITYDNITQTWQSPNRKHNIRSFYELGQWTMQNRVDSVGQNWSISISTEGIYADGQKMDISNNKTIIPIVEKDQIDFSTDVYTEQYINTEQGIRQNFIIKKTPLNTKHLELRLKVKGTTVIQTEDGEINFLLGDTWLTYSDLNVWDVTGKILSAQMKVEKDLIILTTDVSNAEFPITIDPIIANGNPSKE